MAGRQLLRVREEITVCETRGYSWSGDRDYTVNDTVDSIINKVIAMEVTAA